MITALDTFRMLTHLMSRAGVEKQPVIVLETPDYMKLLHLSLHESKIHDDLVLNMGTNPSTYNDWFVLAGIRVERKPKPIYAYREGLV